MPSESWIHFDFDHVRYKALVHRFLGKPVHYVLTLVTPDNILCVRNYSWDFSESDLPRFEADQSEEPISLEAAIAIRAAERAGRFTLAV